MSIPMTSGRALGEVISGSAPAGPSLAQLERTSRHIVWGTRGSAGITMAASAAYAALTYGALGLATGIAVDIALCVALIGNGARRCASPPRPCP